MILYFKSITGQKFKLNPKLVYIKLGSGSEWADECLAKGILRIGFRDIPKELFQTQDLDKIWYKYTELGWSKRAADMYWSQLNTFFNADDNIIWITFHKQKMWWCKAKPGYIYDNDNTKFKEVIGGWSDKDIDGNTLWEDNLSGALLKTKSFSVLFVCLMRTNMRGIEFIVCNQWKLFNLKKI